MYDECYRTLDLLVSCQSQSLRLTTSLHAKFHFHIIWTRTDCHGNLILTQRRSMRRSKDTTQVQFPAYAIRQISFTTVYGRISRRLSIPPWMDMIWSFWRTTFKILGSVPYLQAVPLEVHSVVSAHRTRQTRQAPSMYYACRSRCGAGEEFVWHVDAIRSVEFIPLRPFRSSS